MSTQNMHDLLEQDDHDSSWILELMRLSNTFSKHMRIDALIGHTYATSLSFYVLQSGLQHVLSNGATSGA
jgi:hypothetical protein